MQEEVIVGRCLCGAVSFELVPPIRDVIICHCRQCARWTGYAVAAAAIAPHNLTIRAGATELKWFASSSHAERGFCSVCGSSLFWKPTDATRIAVLAGTIEPPTRLVIAAHVYVGDKSDYYEIGDEAPRFSQGAGDVVLFPR